MKTVAVSVLALVLFVALLVVGYLAFTYYQDKESLDKEKAGIEQQVEKWDYVAGRFRVLAGSVENRCREKFTGIESADVVGYADKIEIRLFTDRMNWTRAEYNSISNELEVMARKFFDFHNVVVGVYDMSENLIIKKDVIIMQREEISKDAEEAEPEPVEEESEPAEETPPAE